MALSARNQLPGTVQEVRLGDTVRVVIKSTEAMFRRAETGMTPNIV
jgi:hypothetical protein